MAKVPTLDPRIASIAPDFRAVSLIVSHDGGPIAPVDDMGLADACRIVGAGAPDWAEEHLRAWADAYVRFGAKPSRTPCSAQALRKRVLRDGSIPSINSVVDLYNAVSLRFAVPVGGENLDAYAGAPFLTVADGTEAFDTVNEGAPAVERALPGEVIWRDGMGVTCRRWNWRQGTRTRLEGNETRMWFVLESLGAMPPSALREASDTLAEGLCRLYPNAELERHVLAASAGFSLPGIG